MTRADTRSPRFREEAKQRSKERMIADIRQMHLIGISNAQIAEHLGITEEMVAKELSKKD